MNIFIKYFNIFSILFCLNSSMFVHITIDKKGLKNENGQFLVKMAKWSNSEWEYDPEAKSEITNPNGVAALDVPKEWEAHFREIRKRTIREPFILAVKVEMVDNKSIRPIPFILNMNGQQLKINLEQEKSGKILGSCSGFGQNKEKIEAFMWKIKKEKEMKKKIAKSSAQNIHNQQLGNLASLQQLSMQNPIKSSLDLLSQWHENEHKLMAQQMTNIQMKNVGNIQEIATKNTVEGSQNEIRKHGKEPMSEIMDNKQQQENLSQILPKLMQSAINAQAIPLKRGQQQYLGQNVGKHGKEKDDEIKDNNRPQKQQKLMENSPKNFD